jgi:uncharacterized protein involved in exopolysaccharide biosynthesis
LEIIDIIRVVRRHYVMIIVFTCLMTSVLTAGSLLIKKKYQSTAILITNTRQDYSSVIGGAIPGLVTETQQGLTVVYMNNVATSDAIAEKVIEKLQMAKKSDFADSGIDDEDRLNVFRQDLSVMAPDDFTLKISFTCSEPRLSSAVANEVAEQTVEYAKNISMEDYEQYKNVVMLYRSQLRELEIRIKDYEEKHGVFKIEDQLSKSIEAQSNYDMQIVEKQSELESLQKLLDNTTDIYLWTGTRQRIDSLKEEIRVLKSNINIIDKSMKDMPEMKREYAEMLRDQNMITMKLSAADMQLDMRKLDSEQAEHRFRILDAAYPSKWQVWPRKKFFAAMGFSIGLVLSVFIAFVIDTMKNDRCSQGETIKSE